MKIFIYNDYGDQYEIKSIEYTQSNGKDTFVDYSNSKETYCVRFEGWLSLEQILNELKEVIDK